MGDTGAERGGPSASPNGDLPIGDELAFRVAGSPDQVSYARHTVGQFLAARAVPAPVAQDVQLIASELVTNAMQHGAPGPIGIEVRVRSELDVTLTVANTGPVGALPPVSAWEPPAGLSVGGRGLGIVRRLSSDIEVLGDAHQATVVCRCAWERTS